MAGAGIATGLLIAAAIDFAGPLAALAPAVAVISLAILRFPGAALALLLGGAVLIEFESPGLLPPIGSFYDVIAFSLTPQEALLLAGLAGVLLRFATESERPRLPEPFVVPLALLGIAVAAGVVTGYYADASVPTGELFHRSMTAFYVILVPLLTVNVLRDTHALLAFAAVACGLAAFKTASGLYAALSGIGTAVEQGVISYLNPVPNLVMLLLVLGVAAALVRRVELPGWVLVAAPPALLALVLSYRRSFWIAAAFTLVVVVLAASRQRGRAAVALAGVAAALMIGATVLLASADDPSPSPLVTRAQTISPSTLGANRGDRYRIDERRNAIENIRRQPLTGNGLGVPWTAHEPLAESHDRRYVHLAVLWFWLSFGPLGVVAYLALLGTALWAAVQVWRRHPNQQVQVAALACLGGILALGVVELTATFTAVEPRASLIVGALLGWLAAAWADLPARRPAQKASRAPLRD